MNTLTGESTYDFPKPARATGKAEAGAAATAGLIPYRVERLIGNKDERYRLYPDTQPDGPIGKELGTIKYVATRTSDTEIILPTTRHEYCVKDTFNDKPGTTRNLYWDYIANGVGTKECVVQVVPTV